MEIIKTGKFVTDFYGSAPAIGAEGILKKWIEDKQSAWLLSWAEQIKKKGQTALQALTEILSIFNRDSEGNPIIGNWMLKRCLVNTGQTIFNAMKDRSHPKKDTIPMAIKLVEPIFITVLNGKLIKKADFVKTYTITTRKNGKIVSFFKAYEVIRAGATFEAKIHVDDSLLSEEHINHLLSKAGMIGVGAFRERFGKFEWM